MKTAKRKKTFRLLAIAMIAIFAFAACGGVEEPVDVDDGIHIDEYRAVEIIKGVLNVELHPLHLLFDTEFENDLMGVDLFIKDSKIRMDSQDPDFGLVSLITNENGDYIVMQDHKAYTKSTEPLDKNNMTFLLTEEEIADCVLSKGQEEIKGVLYDFERFTGEEDVFTFYFVIDTGQWIALETKDTMMYINEVSEEVDDSIFQIPSDFEKIVM